MRLFARGDFNRNGKHMRNKFSTKLLTESIKLIMKSFSVLVLLNIPLSARFRDVSEKKFIHRGSPSSSSSSDASFEVHIHEFMMFRRSFFSRSASAAKARSHETTLKLATLKLAQRSWRHSRSNIRFQIDISVIKMNAKHCSREESLLRRSRR